jgi:hypothetical protein
MGIGGFFPGKHIGRGVKLTSHLHRMLSASTRVYYSNSDSFNLVADIEGGTQAEGV